MSASIDELFEGASPDPGNPPDLDGLWMAGRRRRRWRQAAAVTGALALLGVAGGVAAGMDTLRTPEIDVAAPPEASEDTEVDLDEPTPVPLDEPADDEEPVDPEPETDEHATERGPAPEELMDTEPETTEPEEATDPPPAPQPDPERIEDPCAPHQDGEPAAFIDLVAPVDGQRIDDAIEVVGCASVFEATVRYRLLDAAGAVIADDITTATAGGPDIGEFREVITTGDATGELTLEVFWDSPADGGEHDLTAVRLHAG